MKYYKQCSDGSQRLNLDILFTDFHGNQTLNAKSFENE